jgi:hypothetical protein
LKFLESCIFGNFREKAVRLSFLQPLFQCISHCDGLS